MKIQLAIALDNIFILETLPKENIRAKTNPNGSEINKSKIGSGRGKAGEVLSDQLEIACGNNLSIKVIEIQRQGKKIQKIGEFMLGSQIKKGLFI